MNIGKEGEAGMDLVERYLKAVAAQLPKDNREDIVAELRDEIMGRLEALEARLGRAPTDDEVEAAVTTPPARTRAWARGRFLAELGDRIRAAGWDHVVVVDSRGHERHVDLTDPYVGSREYCEAHPDFLGPDGPDQYPY